MSSIKMTFNEMISALDGVNGRLLLELPNNKVIEDVMNMITEVSLSLDEWAQDIEVNKQENDNY